MTASGFDQVQVLIDSLSSKVRAVPTRFTSTITVADAALIVLNMALRSGNGVPGTRRAGF